jgi:hypothetical protein
VIHDQSNAIPVGDPTRTPRATFSRQVGTDPETGQPIYSDESYAIEDRTVRGGYRGNSARTLGFNNNSMTNADTRRYINYTPRTVGPPENVPAGIRDGNRTGTVDINGYMQWLRDHGYCFAGDACARPGG